MWLVVSLIFWLEIVLCPFRRLYCLSGLDIVLEDALAADTKKNKGVNTPWGGTSSTAIVTVSYPAEWHTGPFCHVYIAACESLDHCQTKVKPVLQAFLSQIESSVSSTTANQQRQQGGHTADYVIVNVPINGGASTADKLHHGFQSIARWKQCLSTKTL
ncbi:hypothetical protein IV203_025051 [Nitzschia inconspicua]|uniref:Uncharacterized protein n=1 Tax=Nitzschia inconspicua TaxID=303405 RepID=A0A9K3LPB3_9STRA|nr:hypothetical protein IV203_037003 [Nitzschia inconspicua]KAG7339608.1 hypothetical protein IV203_025201 [Nitzschia inconspicua]KAG7365610.1 hypothetical protein IV203_025051 [Nitzschia inconspicua]